METLYKCITKNIDRDWKWGYDKFKELQKYMSTSNKQKIKKLFKIGLS